MPIGQIQVKDLVKKQPGFPFGLVLEHSFVQLDGHTAIQKRDPKTTSVVEIISSAEAVEPYLKLNGYEATHHVFQSTSH